MKRAYSPLYVALVTVITAYFIGQIICSLHAGSFPRIPGPPIYRASSPGWFWFDILFSAVCAAYGSLLIYFEWRRK